MGWRRNKNNESGSALPVVFAIGLGVIALASGFAIRTMREQGRNDIGRYSTQALYQAFAQVEVVGQMVNTSSYDEAGQNACLGNALARGDNQFIDKDGWPTGVTVTEVGGADSGMFEIWAEATVRGYTRRVTALVRERQSFADFNYFVSSHPLGIAGGEDGAFPYPDAPEGSIHSNDEITFYFPDRHFRDPVTAAGGFDYTAGATGTENTHFHGPTNDAANVIDGLTDVDPADFATRSDNLLTIDGDASLDYARVWLMGDQVLVHHRQKGHLVIGDPVSTWIDDYNYGPPYNVTVNDWGWVLTPVWTRTFTAYMQSDPYWHWGPWYQVFITGGGGSDTSGDGGSGDVGYWEWTRDWIYQAETVRDYDNDVYEWVDQSVWTQLATTHEETRQDRVEPFGHYEMLPEETWVSEQTVATYTLDANGTIYVIGDIFLEEAYSGTHGHDVHVLDGKLTLASGDDILIQDSIVYGVVDGDGNLQTAYLNGNDKDLTYQPNPDYDGASVLGLLASDRIEYQSSMPDQSEVNATMLAKNAQVAVDGVSIDSDGDVTPTSGGFVKTSLRRLGGIVSNRRPVSSYVDGNNAVTRGFIYGKSVFDVRQRTSPPLGFPTLNRPRVLALVLREVQ